jgi:hypothetical protein
MLERGKVLEIKKRVRVKPSSEPPTARCFGIEIEGIGN